MSVKCERYKWKRSRGENKRRFLVMRLLGPDCWPKRKRTGSGSVRVACGGVRSVLAHFLPCAGCTTACVKIGDLHSGWGSWWCALRRGMTSAASSAARDWWRGQRVVSIQYKARNVHVMNNASISATPKVGTFVSPFVCVAQSISVSCFCYENCTIVQSLWRFMDVDSLVFS